MSNKKIILNITTAIVGIFFFIYYFRWSYSDHMKYVTPGYQNPFIPIYVEIILMILVTLLATAFVCLITWFIIKIIFLGIDKKFRKENEEEYEQAIQKSFQKTFLDTQIPDGAYFESFEYKLYNITAAQMIFCIFYGALLIIAIILSKIMYMKSFTPLNIALLVAGIISLLVLIFRRETEEKEEKVKENEKFRIYQDKIKLFPENEEIVFSKINKIELIKLPETKGRQKIRVYFDNRIKNYYLNAGGDLQSIFSPTARDKQNNAAAQFQTLLEYLGFKKVYEEGKRLTFEYHGTIESEK